MYFIENSILDEAKESDLIVFCPITIEVFGFDQFGFVMIIRSVVQTKQ